ncbi:MAG: hypothetical protein LBC68_09790 [Prevotellaceae bacterium]|nr:hypothetical protein [Prevotellaceae bacterium]
MLQRDVQKGLKSRIFITACHRHAVSGHTSVELTFQAVTTGIASIVGCAIA